MRAPLPVQPAPGPERRLLSFSVTRVLLNMPFVLFQRFVNHMFLLDSISVIARLKEPLTYLVDGVEALRRLLFGLDAVFKRGL